MNGKADIVLKMNLQTRPREKLKQVRFWLEILPGAIAAICPFPTSTHKSEVSK